MRRRWRGRGERLGAGAGVEPGAASRLSEGLQERVAASWAPPDAVDDLQGHVIAGSRGGTRRAVQQPMVAYDLGSVVMGVPTLHER